MIDQREVHFLHYSKAQSSIWQRFYDR